MTLVFSIVLDYNEVLDLSQEQLDRLTMYLSREEIIDWLQWNDPNGIYKD